MQLNFIIPSQSISISIVRTKGCQLLVTHSVHATPQKGLEREGAGLCGLEVNYSVSSGGMTLMRCGSPVKDLLIFLRIKVTACCRVVHDRVE